MRRKTLLDIDYVNSELVEAVDSKGNKQPYLLLTGMVADVVNINKRRYPLSEVRTALNPFTEDVANGLGSALMLADHPVKGVPPSVKDAAALIKEVHLDEDTKAVKVKAQLLDNIQGNNMLAIAKAGGKIGVSSRALGNLTEVMENGEVVHEVKDLQLKGFDFVVFPSLGAEATSEALVYEHLQEEIKKIFPTLETDLKELKESLHDISERLESEDLSSLKAQIVKSLMESMNCVCKSGVSEVLINSTEITNDETQLAEATLKKEEVEVMKTIQEIQESYPELYKQIVDMVTAEVTASVTESVTKDVTDKVTKEVTEAVAQEVKTALEKELAEATEQKVSDVSASLEEANKRIGEFETEITSLKEDTQPYIDILEGLVTFMREKGLLINEDEVLKGAAPVEEKKEETVEADDSHKKLAEEMTAVINEQKTKLDEALVRIEALEVEKKGLEEAKALAEAEKVKAEIQNAIQDVLTKEAKYASILKPKLEGAASIEDVTKIYEAEKAFIDNIEKLNKGEEIPAGQGKVEEAEKVEPSADGKTEVTESVDAQTQLEALKVYQQRLAGIVIKK